MGFFEQILLIVLLVGISAFFAVSEISIAASRKARLSVLADEGNEAAARDGLAGEAGDEGGRADELPDPLAEPIAVALQQRRRRTVPPARPAHGAQ